MFFVSRSTDPAPAARGDAPLVDAGEGPRRPAWTWLAVVAAVLVGLSPLLLPYFRDLGQRPPYAMYPLVIVAAGVLAISRLAEVDPTHLRPGGRWIGGGLLGGGLLMLVIGTAAYVRWLAAPATLVTLAGIVWLVGGRTLARALMPAAVLLLTIVPPPARGETTLTAGLQQLSVAASSRLLDVCGIVHLRTGNVLAVPGHRLLIEEACSGINSVVAVSAFTILAGFWRRRPAWWTATLLPIALLFVIGLNVVRITGGAMLLAGTGVNLFEGIVHEWFGLILFACAVGLVLGADAGIEWLGGERGTERGAKERVASAPSIRENNRPIACAFAVLFLIAGAWSASALRHCWPASRLPAVAPLRVPTTVGEWTLQPARADGKDIETTSTTARNVRHWIYRSADGTTAEVAFAYPFTSWFHDPRVCYAAAGWSPGPHVLVDETAAAFRFDMTQIDGRHATVFFADFAEAGFAQHPFERPAEGDRLSRRLALTRRAASYQPTCEVQTLVHGDGPIDPSRCERVRELFLIVRESLRQQVIGQTGGGR